jgi:DNA-directed RNA polymerase subunit M/transcription elongation factor TFIIS
MISECFICSYDKVLLTTPCNHTLCEDCLNKLVSKICPFCRADINEFFKKLSKPFESLGKISEADEIDYTYEPQTPFNDETHSCRFCGGYNINITRRQLRGADEGETLIIQCNNCYRCQYVH